MTERFGSEAPDASEQDDRASVRALESRIAELEGELVYWRNRAVADWAKATEQVRLAESKLKESKKDVALRMRARRKTGAMLRRLGLR